jgi:hypothetical protein
MITGTVTDQTPATKGTPAMSDASMNLWMEYLYMQKTIPGNATGVPVILTAIDSNMNTVDIGTATSDMAGNFGISWVPEIAGDYQIIATFAGSNSYGSSFSTTYLVVDPAATQPTATPTATETPAATPTPIATSSPTVAPQPDSGVSTETLLIASAAIIIVVAVLAAALVLRKRK